MSPPGKNSGRTTKESVVKAMRGDRPDTVRQRVRAWPGLPGPPGLVVETRARTSGWIRSAVSWPPLPWPSRMWSYCDFGTGQELSRDIGCRVLIAIGLQHRCSAADSQRQLAVLASPDAGHRRNTRHRRPPRRPSSRPAASAACIPCRTPGNRAASSSPCRICPLMHTVDSCVSMSSTSKMRSAS